MKAASATLNAIALRREARAVVTERFRPGPDALNQDPATTAPVYLTPRQREVLSLLGEGLPNKLICQQLNISTGTVKVHIRDILRELGVASRLQAVVAAQRCGLLGAFAAGASAKEFTGLFP